MTAREWAAEHPAGVPVHWLGVEVAAFEGHPEVVTLLDPKGRFSRRRTKSGGHSMGVGRALALGALFLAAAVVFLFPAVVGFALLIGDRFGRWTPDPRVAIPAAGLVFAFSFVMLAVSFIPWVARGRKKDGMRETQSIVAVVFGAISIVVAVVRAGDVEVTLLPLWVGLMALTTVFGLVFFVLLIVARRAQAARDVKSGLRGGTGSAPAEAAPDPVREAVAGLSAAEREAIRQDLDAAIDDFAARDIIGAAEARRAHEAELGNLYASMS